MNTNDFNLLSVLKLERERLEICENNKENVNYKIVMKWIADRIKQLKL